MFRIFMKAASQSNLDISFSVSRTHMVRIAECPGLWMDSGELDKLLSDLRTVASKTLPAGDLDYGVFDRDRSHLSRSISTLITLKSDQRLVPDWQDLPKWHQQEYIVLIAEIAELLAKLLPDLSPEGLVRRAQTLFAAAHGVVQLSINGQFGDAPREHLTDEVHALVKAFTEGMRQAS